jgi:hypothetical protein
MHTDRTEAQTRKDIVDELAKWNYDQPRTIGRYDFPPPETIGGRTATVRFELRGKPVVLTCQSQATYRQNLRCLYYAVEALRLNEKRGINETLREAYAQLPPPVSAPPAPESTNPYDVLQVPRGASLEVCEAAYRTLINQHHPDRGGSDTLAARLNAAIAQIRDGVKAAR